MKKSNMVWLSIVGLIAGVVTITSVNGSINPAEDQTVKIEREQQHITAMAEGADPSMGTTTIPQSGMVDGSFETHLPIVVIDLEGNEIPVAKETTADQQVIYKDIDPYVVGNISIIDNADHRNSLEDDSEFTSRIKIKYRGNMSLNFDKKQYGIKLVDDNMASQKLSVLGMEPNNDWILNISQLDESLIRNYLAYSIGSALFEETPDCRFCEVVFKDEVGYRYQGVYLMLEKVEKGEGRVDLNSYESGDRVVDYLLCRDREDERETQISTYGNESGLTGGRLSVLYPDAEAIDDYAFNYIQKDIDRIDRVLYSEEDATFASWPEYIDVNSFADYFIFNEYFGNYDAGHNSTYMYRKGSGKLCMGPLWDYDGSMDNGVDIANPEHLAFYESPWFEKLVTSRRFMDISYDRYQELTGRGNLLSPEFITDYIDDISAYLGNAALRDRSRWNASYNRNVVHDAEDFEGNMIPRDTENWQDEVIRLRSYFVVKAQYMSDGLVVLRSETTDRESNGTFFAVIMIAMFICSIVLVRRKGSFR